MTRTVRRNGTGPEAQPPALDRIGEIAEFVGQRELAVFVDFDGTLAPIVDRPENAYLDDGMRATLVRLAGVCTVAVISGRALDDVAARVGLPDLYYAGNHGLEIRGPDHADIAYRAGEEYRDRIEQACRRLRTAIGGVPGVLIENKRYSLSVHYRRTPERDIGAVATAVDEIVTGDRGLRRHEGKKVFEIRPRIDWDKGKAVLWLLEALDLHPPAVVPIFIGDDVTDEDAFAALGRYGIGIRVMAAPQASHADYRLHDTDEVQSFLDALIPIARRTA